MNIPINTQQLFSILRQLAAFVAIGTQIANVGHLGALRAPLAVVAGLLLTVEHYVGDPSTGSTPPKAQGAQ